MPEHAAHASFLPPVLIFCAAAVIAVPVFRRMGLSGVLGYLVAGLVIGPSGLSLIGEAETVRGVAEIGVVFLLFIVGLELKLSRLLSMRRDIFGLGAAQLLATATIFGAVAVAAGAPARSGVVIGLALALSATSIALQLLEERGDLQSAYGQRSFAILLFQDLSIAPILALMPLLATAGAVRGEGGVLQTLIGAATAISALAAVVLVGRYGLNPFFRLLAASGAREVMTASALLVVLGTALLMEKVGLSMAMGAFLAGVLLAESNFRHQLEADIEPFRGILLGLFFMSVGMSIDRALIAQHWPALLLATLAAVAAKIAIIAFLLRAFGSPRTDALRGGAVLAMAGEFAFVLLPVAAALGLLTGAMTQFVTALAALTMLVAPLAAKVLDLALARRPRAAPEPEPNSFDGPDGRVLVIGFGRFGQIVDQVLLAKGISVTVIEKNVDRIRAAARFGFRIFYGDGTRLDVLRAAGIERADVVCICVDDREAALKIVEIVHEEFPQVRTCVRAYDRIHAIDLMKREADFQIRETFESALAFGQAALEELGLDPSEAAAVTADVRRRDIARLVMQKSEGIMGGADLLHGTRLEPEPLIAPRARSHGLSPETRDIIGEDEHAGA
ncbi:MAG: potassium efflux system protein [Microvirga sp.]|jgi:CPA2 family monovalent cation:H+ antiporter-2/glutathione-regulated potassium-efflux system protein KefB|nr:potassium efflux system protein [Microvirga sp.]